MGKIRCITSTGVVNFSNWSVSIWDPLLRIKFGSYHDQISAAWVWHRVPRVAKSRERIWEPEKLGYLIGGTQTLVTELVSRISLMPNVKILLNKSVTKINTAQKTIKNIQLDDGQVIPCEVPHRSGPVALIVF